MICSKRRVFLFSIGAVFLIGAHDGIAGPKHDPSEVSEVGGEKAPVSSSAAAGEGTRRLSPREEYADPTCDTAFKQLLSIGLGGNDFTIAASFLNCFIPDFADSPISWLEEQPVAIPALPRKGEKQTFMDFHVKTVKGEHVVVEMQVRRHILFDERALFYAASTYARQIDTGKFKDSEWYRNLRTTYALQILNYDSDRLKGISDRELEDTQVKRTADHPMKDGEYVKHYVMTDKHSGQTIDHLQMIQVELPRGPKSLFPPRGDFSEKDWWLSLLKHAKEYSTSVLDGLADQGIEMPENIKRAFGRLKLEDWNPDMIREYESDKLNLGEYAAVLAVERTEGQKEGMEKGLKEGKEQGIKEGEKKGEKAKALETARKMLVSGKVDDEFIAQMTGLDLSDVERLKE